MLKLVIIPGLITRISEAAIRVLEGIPSRGCIKAMQDLHNRFFYPQKGDVLSSEDILDTLHVTEDMFGIVYTQGSPDKHELDILLKEFPETQIVLPKIPLKYWIGYCIDNWDYKDAVKKYAQSMYDILLYKIPYTPIKIDHRPFDPVSDAKFKSLCAVINNISITDINGKPLKRNWVQYLS